ncbi:MAG: hypothetical protein H7343_12780 [Undibacterium sp.]|nr:hypothetical protein [Opitutaceae bacterium]
MFYRGGWRPFCNRELAEFEPKLTALGDQIIAFSTDAPAGLAPTAEKKSHRLPPRLRPHHDCRLRLPVRFPRRCRHAEKIRRLQHHPRPHPWRARRRLAARPHRLHDRPRPRHPLCLFQSRFQSPSPRRRIPRRGHYRCRKIKIGRHPTPLLFQRAPTTASGLFVLTLPR